MKNNFWTNEKGDTNFVSIIITLAVIGVAVMIFKDYIAQGVQWILGLFS